MKNEELKNRYDFLLIFDVQDGNPNGDPDAGNLPRVDAETGEGLVTDVCLKRKIRNYVQLTQVNSDGSCKDGLDIYVKEKAVLGRAHVKAYKDLEIDVGAEAVASVPESILSELDDLDLCEGIERRRIDDQEKIAVLASAEKKVIKDWMKETKLSKELKKFLDNTLKEANPRKLEYKEVEKGRTWMCEHYFDIRTFGAVMSLKSAPNCGQVRGPVQMTFARSVGPVVTSEHTITRMAVATEKEAEEQNGDNHTIGRKNTIPYGLYVAHGFISPALAKQTGFGTEDLSLLWEALRNMFEHDRSAARGLMSTRKLVIFKHDSALGNAPACELFDLVKITPKSGKVPRSFHDFDIEIGNAPAGVTIL